MRTSDPALMAQVYFENFTGGKYQAQQHIGVYIGIVTETHSTNSEIPKGTLRFSIPSFNNSAGWVTAPFVGSIDPPIGTECIVAFEGVTSSSPRVIGFTNWQSPRITVSTTDPIANYSPTIGDLWIQP